jgi:hypothetical protein
LSDTETQQDTPVTVTPSPMDMPGARKESVPPATVAEEPKSAPKPAAAVEESVPSSLSSEEREELDRLRNFRKQSRDWEKTAKANYEDAQRFRQMLQQFGGNEESGEPDPLAEVQKLRDEVEGERRERMRERVARETGVPPSQITGSDEEEMKESAAQALSWAREFIKQAGVPLAAPASNVNSDGKPHDERAGQIKSRDDLKSMSPSEITQAYREGRLDALMGKQT